MRRGTGEPFAGPGPDTTVLLPAAAPTANYKAVVAYEGSSYFGFQLQPERPTIQQKLEDVLTRLTRQHRDTLRFFGSSRTDAGVHATGQVISFNASLVQPSSLADWQFSINRMLPPDIRLRELTRVPSDFNARASATGKLYHYSVQTEQPHDPFTYRHRMHVWQEVDLQAIREASAMFIGGPKNFLQFSNVAVVERNPVKTLRRLDVITIPGGFRLEFEGDGFLYKMVRHLVGALLAVGMDHMQPSALQGLLDIGSQRAPGSQGWRGYKVADAQGLCLMNVHYPALPADPDCFMYPDLPHDQHGRVTSGGSTE